MGTRANPFGVFRRGLSWLSRTLTMENSAATKKAVGANKDQDDKDLPSQVEKRHGRNCGVNATPARLNRRWRKCNA